MASLAHVSAELDNHSALYRGMYNFLVQFIELLEIDRR
ncbi:hypothetical protein SAMN05444123_11037 [Rhodopseudomonas pseudopalustris]|uniref:Uncharacterized protein n=1 Tax=Rhodopseudomonas pseudopalustris TaxID=1513892 RepID=A0A1H8VYB5_9BRAD|nr:hypothetical protein SAMN05444123_11037 [Rhodopseudomonas pseudopalustris]